MGAHKFGSIQQGIVFVCVKVSETSIFYIFQNETKSQIHFCCTFEVVEKMIKFLVHDCFVESFHCVTEYFVSCPFKFGIHQKMLTRTQLFSQTVILNLSPYVSHYLPQPHHLSLIRSAFRVAFFHVDVKRKVLEALDNKVSTWKRHQVLGRCVSWRYDNYYHFGILWRNWDIGSNTMLQPSISSCDAQH